jgi:predicted DNA-binding protein (MmcQ/YjbR family)
VVFKVGAKMFTILTLEPRPVCLAFKTSPEDLGELIERPGIVPAPYLARAKWVALESFAAMPHSELEARLRLAHELVCAKLPKKIRRDPS